VRLCSMGLGMSLMEYLSLMEREPSEHGASAHLMAVARFNP